LKLNIEIKKIFTPEHGYKGEKPNGANISDDIDKKTGLEIISLHGKKRKYGELSNEDLEGIEMMIFDIQDVGVRFYTHISTSALRHESMCSKQYPFNSFRSP
jgi:uncharacterized protein YbbC (DUF1343 family)